MSGLICTSSSGDPPKVGSSDGISSKSSSVKTLLKNLWNSSTFSLLVVARVPSSLSISSILILVFSLELAYFQNALGFVFTSLYICLCTLNLVPFAQVSEKIFNLERDIKSRRRSVRHWGMRSVFRDEIGEGPDRPDRWYPYLSMSIIKIMCSVFLRLQVILSRLLHWVIASPVEGVLWVFSSVSWPCLVVPVCHGCRRIVHLCIFYWFHLCERPGILLEHVVGFHLFSRSPCRWGCFCICLGSFFVTINILVLA